MAAQGSRPDVLVVGGGVFGLAVAEAAIRAGLRVTLAEAERIGAGASGGPVGALVPMSPIRWDALRAFQLAGLRSLEGEAGRLAALTGRDPGWRRTGRVMPLGDAAARVRALEQARAAAAHWPAGVRCEVRDAPPEEARLAAGAAPAGALVETLSARVDPPAWLATLRAALDGTEVLEGWRMLGLDRGGNVRFERGTVSAGHVVLATGWRCFTDAGGLPGGGIKGQAALLAAPATGSMPMVAAPGLYVVPQPGGVAVGSTRERQWQAPGPDHKLDAVLARATALLPGLAGAPVLRRWAGIRPRAERALPLVGPLPEAPRVIVATGAGGIGFAIAHLVAEAVVGRIVGREPRHHLPPGSAPGG